MMRLFQSSSLLLFCHFIFVVDSKHPLGRHVELTNESGEKLELEWVHPITGEKVPYGSTDVGGKVAFDSYVNHTFFVKSLSPTDGHETGTMFLTVGDEEDQVILIKKDLEVEHIEDDHPLGQEAVEDGSIIVQKCRGKAQRALKESLPTEKIMKDLQTCLTRETAAVLEIKNEELAFQRAVRKNVANLAENYTCADPKMTTTKPKELRNWTYEGVTREVGILHERRSSQIHILNNFISPEECEAIKKAAAPGLHRGTVADGKGGSKLSENRKAWQAGIRVKDWRDEKDPIAAVKRRLFAYTNEVTGYDMRIDGQEEIMSIQYFGEGANNTKPDRYTPHCDGDCDGLPHKKGGRVATIVMYCDVPEVGGATNFQHANVYVKPAIGAAAFFSYMDPVTKLHEEGFTTHSGCPVIEGTKRIAVQWMRVGVDNENPWDSFDTNTIQKK